jgi:predicted lipoprotein with Yx(FWY)xxD motif
MSAFDIGKLSLGAAAGATALVALLAACGSNSSSAGSASTTSQGTPTVSGASTLKTTSTPIGTVLVDPSGRTVYELVGDTAANQTCTAGCLAIWPAVMAGGSQVVVNGHPAFTYAGDSSAGQTKGQNLKDQWGLWLALDANGNPINASAAGSSAAATTKAPPGGGPAF